MKTKLLLGVQVALLSVFTMGTKSWGQSDYMPPMSGWPAVAQNTWQVQGEYYGSITGGENLGAWVIANGTNIFTVVFLPGGLVEIPGQTGGGWDGTTRITGINNVSLNTTTNAFVGTATNGYKTTTITGTGVNRVLNGTTSTGASFALTHLVRKSPTQGLKPKAEWGSAQVWYDSSTSAADLTKWTANSGSAQAKYGGYLYRGVTCKTAHQSMYLHIEVRTCFNPNLTGQERGNSGIYLRGMHEMQVLDSFGLPGVWDEMGAIYKIQAPLTNAKLPPGTNQTYDCYYTAGTGTTGTFTVYLNGVLVQKATSVTKITEAGYAGTALTLQDHNHEVDFNNIWAIPNATTTSLPWTTVISGITTGVSPYQITPIQKSSIEASKVQTLFNLSGQKISGFKKSGSKLMILPIRK
jgi:hypothetical protein